MIALATIARGDMSRISEPRQILARDAAAWTALWAAHAGPDSPVPDVDFSTSMVAAAFAGEQPSAGHAIEIASALPRRGEVQLIVESRAPGPGTLTAQVVTSPFHIVSLPRTAGEIRWATPETRDAARQAGRRPGRSAHEPSSTGLRPRTASALAYLAGPFSGAIILLAESTNETVRFHAWQSILGLGALVLVVIGAFVVAGASLFVSASGVPVMINLAFALCVGLMVVWAVCLWAAIAGHRWKLPLAGAWAERLATRPRARAAK